MRKALRIALMIGLLILSIPATLVVGTIIVAISAPQAFVKWSDNLRDWNAGLQARYQACEKGGLIMRMDSKRCSLKALFFPKQNFPGED